MTEKKSSPSRGRTNFKTAVGQRSTSLEKTPTTGQLIFNIVLALLGLLVAALMFTLGINWANNENISAGVGLILAGLFVFWRGGNRVSSICAELKMRRQK
ncbi:MAG: hypothetical protein JXB23_05040 [Candidatus Aminicenantes bacterium]|nr:hypothetical protein [Candidatus Aminicenantes bacterium]